MINFKFEIDNKIIQSHSTKVTKKKTNIFKRWIARIMCMIIYKDECTHYQFSGWNGFLKKEYVSCDASKFQIMHWLLSIAGYKCCVADIMERCGIDPEIDTYDKKNEIDKTKE